MSDRITLTPRVFPSADLEVEGLTPDTLASLSQADIATLPIWLGRQRATLGDFFDIQGERSHRVLIEGDVSRVRGLGAGMSGGELFVIGNAGGSLGAGMSGGLVEVQGNAGDDAGVGMSGGVMRIAGNAGDRVGGARADAFRGMTGGEIIVRGSVGRDAAARCRRGLLVVLGSTGSCPARAMIAGTLVVFGAVGDDPGFANKRGSLVAVGPMPVPSTYRYASTFEPPYVRLLMTHLRRGHGLTIDEAVITSRYQRFCGDLGVPGRGEILLRIATSSDR